MALHEECEVITTIIRVVNLSDFDGVVSQEVVNDEREVIESSVEPQDSSVVVEELLLRLYSTTTKRFLHVLSQRGIAELLLWDLVVCEAVHWNIEGLSLRISKTLYQNIRYKNQFP